MRLFDWLKPSRTPVELTRDYVNINDSALANVLEGGSAVVLEKGQILVPPSKYPEAQRIATSLRYFPGDWAWKHKGYTIYHVPTGFALWVANEDYGLKEDVEGSKTKFTKEEQTIIWREVKTWLDRFKVGFTGRLPKVKISGKSGTYWCVADGHPWAGVGDSPARAYESWAKAVSVEQRRLNPGQKLSVWSAPQ